MASAPDSRLVEVGELIVDVNGNGNGRFTVPEVRNGDYAVITKLQLCAPSSGGRAILPWARFPRSGSSPARSISLHASGCGYSWALSLS